MRKSCCDCRLLRGCAGRRATSRLLWRLRWAPMGDGRAFLKPTLSTQLFQVHLEKIPTFEIEGTMEPTPRHTDRRAHSTVLTSIFTEERVYIMEPSKIEALKINSQLHVQVARVCVAAAAARARQPRRSAPLTPPPPPPRPPRSFLENFHANLRTSFSKVYKQQSVGILGNGASVVRRRAGRPAQRAHPSAAPSAPPAPQLPLPRPCADPYFSLLPPAPPWLPSPPLPSLPRAAKLCRPRGRLGRARAAQHGEPAAHAGRRRAAHRAARHGGAL